MAKDEIVDTMKDLVGKYHPDLAPVVDEIAIVFKDKSSTVDDKVVAGKTAKASPLLSTISNKDWKFVITLGADVWGEMDSKSQIALIDHHLCACGVKEDKDGNLKCYVRQPDIAFFKAEVERHGLWRTSGTDPNPNLIADIFG